jgi:hypothetical protein
LTWRRLAVLVHHLPDDSATWVAIHGEKALWGTTDYLLAAVVDNLAAANWQRGGGKGQRPKPLQRPKSAQEIRAKRQRMQAMERKNADWRKRNGVKRG